MSNHFHDAQVGADAYGGSFNASVPGGFHLPCPSQQLASPSSPPMQLQSRRSSGASSVYHPQSPQSYMHPSQSSPPLVPGSPSSFSTGEPFGPGSPQFYPSADPPVSPFLSGMTLEDTKPALALRADAGCPAGFAGAGAYGDAKASARIRALELENEELRVRLLSCGMMPPADWDARTSARKRLYCSPNRAGNSLCAWHDSRRERRQFAARSAPDGLLNCGCREEEALFEEALTSAGVGSYRPGDAVRMDPALRRPLLDLLRRRYGYRDGDFDLNPQTGEWLNGRNAAFFEQELRSSTKNK